MRITLQAREGAMLAAGGAVRVRCLAGLLWIVGQCDCMDRVLAAGDSADLAAAQRQYLSSVGREQQVSFELSGPGASIRVRSLDRAGESDGNAARFAEWLRYLSRRLRILTG
jgi:hypothetical protein